MQNRNLQYRFYFIVISLPTSNRRLHGDFKLVKEGTGVDEEIINLRYSFLGRKERRHNARGPVRFRTKGIFLPSNCLCLSSVPIPFTRAVRIF